MNANTYEKPQLISYEELPDLTAIDYSKIPD